MLFNESTVEGVALESFAEPGHFVGYDPHFALCGPAAEQTSFVVVQVGCLRKAIRWLKQVVFLVILRDTLLYVNIVER